MDEFIKSFKAWLYDKSSNPLFFIFFLCWLAWNYKLLVVAFADGDPTTKLGLINSILYPTSNAKWCFMLIYPALTAGATVIVYPLLSNLSAIIFKFYENIFAKILLNLDQKKPVDEEIVNLLRAELVSSQEKITALESSKNSEITNLRKSIAALQGKIPTENKMYPHSELAELDIKIMEFMGENFDQGKSFFPQRELPAILKSKFGAKSTEIDVALSKLQRAALLERVGNDFNGYNVVLSDAGKEFVLKIQNKPSSYA